MDLDSIVKIGTLLLYNLAMITLHFTALKNIDIDEAMKEKNIQPNVETSNAQNMQQGQVSGNGKTSYSRVAGMIGVSVMAVFFWAFGNVIIYKAFNTDNYTAIQALVGSIATYIVAGASMFAPYAVNKVSSIFNSAGKR